MADATMPSFPTREEVDFVVVGSGSSGGIMAKELSAAGFKIVVLEQGPHLQAADFKHDEWDYDHSGGLSWGGRQGHPQTFRRTEDEVAELRDDSNVPLQYAHNVGGSSVHYSGNFWRLRPIDFMEASVKGTIPGTNFADWPIRYEDLEPYYTKVDWEIGLSGAPTPSDPPRSRPYPCKPMPVKGPGVIMERAANKLGWTASSAPVALLSEPHNGRPACIHCGFCNGYGCEVNAKSSTMATMIPIALETGNCELRTGCTAARVVTGEDGRVSEVEYWDADGNLQAQRTKAAVLCANGAETPRLLLLSASAQHPDGLANSSGMVGKNLMFNGYCASMGIFEHPVNGWKSIPATRVIYDFYEIDPSEGFYGGGGIDSRHPSRGAPMGFAMNPSLSTGKSWGSDFKNALAYDFSHVAAFTGHTTTIPMSRNNVSLDPTYTDKWGRPVLRTTFQDHPDDIATMKFFSERCDELMVAADAISHMSFYPEESGGGVHLLGTCRMGDDPDTSVVDKYNRAHDVPNLFMVDGSSLVTSTRGQPTITIMALSFRAADNIIQAARRGDI